MQIRDRIKELRRVPASELKPSPRNWRTHPQAQQDALRGVLAEVGYAAAALARELPDGSLELIDGHLRAETTPDQEIPVLVLDVTADEAAKLLATFDPLGAMAEADAVKLDALLRDVNTGSEALSQMLADLAEANGMYETPGEKGENDPGAEWEGMPQCENEDMTGIRAIVHFETEADKAAFEKLVGQKIPDNTKAIWYPAKKWADMKSMQYVHES